MSLYNSSLSFSLLRHQTTSISVRPNSPPFLWRCPGVLIQIYPFFYFHQHQVKARKKMTISKNSFIWIWFRLISFFRVCVGIKKKGDSHHNTTVQLYTKNKKFDAIYTLFLCLQWSLTLFYRYLFKFNFNVNKKLSPEWLWLFFF